MKKPHAYQNPEIKKQKPLTIFRTVIPKLSSGSNPFSKNSDPSPLFPWEPNWPDPDRLWSEPPPPGFRVSSRKSAAAPPLLKPLNGFLAGWNSIFRWKREEEDPDDVEAGEGSDCWISDPKLASKVSDIFLWSSDKNWCYWKKIVVIGVRFLL